MTDENKKKLALAALICLAPGGFILGATLAANHYRKKRAALGTAPNAAPIEASEISEDRK